MNFFLVSGPMWAKLFLPRSTKILQIRKSANSKINKFIIDSECTPFIICDFWRLQLSRNTYYIYLILPLEPISTPQLLANYKKIWQKELSIVKKGRIVKKNIYPEKPITSMPWTFSFIWSSRVVLPSFRFFQQYPSRLYLTFFREYRSMDPLFGLVSEKKKGDQV